jgi:hypothetical protein
VGTGSNEARSQDRLAETRASLKAELWKYEITLCELTARVTFSAGVEQEFVAASRGKAFVIRNDHTWWTLRDTNDMLVINLASYVRGLSDHRGLFGQIRGSWMPALKSTPPLGGIASYREKVIKKTSREIIAQRFPGVTGRGEITVEDLDRAVNDVSKQLTALLKDRDRNRAHRHQHESVGDTDALGTADLRSAVSVVQALLSDLRYLVEASTLDYPENIFDAQVKPTAQEFVDQVLLGTRAQRDLLEQRLLQAGPKLLYSWQRRERVYEILHQRHDALADRADCFNSDTAVIDRDE